ncbi:MAG TPA: LPS export ABC transporter periplasmic protein LptC [Rhizomicrobium sp.]
MVDRRAVTGAIAEPIGQKPAPARPRMDWGDRKRDNIEDAERYTRFVNIMKRSLFGAAIILLGAVIVYSLQPRQAQKMAMTFEKMGLVAGDLSMIKPKLNGTDSEGNPFVVTADTAVQNPKNMRQATLKNVDADINLKSGKWMNVTAPHGELNSDARTLDLWGPIAVFMDDGSEMHTDVAHVDLAKGIVIGPHHVRGQGPQGTYVADRFRIERLSDPCNKSKKPGTPTHVSHPKHPGHRPEPICPVRPAGTGSQKAKPLIYLYGNVHMLIYPSQGKKK